MSVSIFAPISIGNLSVGFDTLGLALSPIDGSLIGDSVHIERPDNSENTDQFILTGSHASKLPQEKESNIVWHSVLLFNRELEKKKIQPQTIKITLEKNIPVSSGLGSSACSVVAGLVALNEYYQKPFNQLQMLRLMGQMESQISGSLHYDNVAPCYMGGLQLMLSDESKITQSIPTFNDVYWVIAYPDVEISTKAAREILPQSYDRQTTIEFGQNLAGFIDASYRQDKVQAFRLLKDVIAEPYRKNLLPNFELAKRALLDFGALSVGISGSGPTLFCPCDDLAAANKIAGWLEQNYLQSTDGFVSICKVDNSGARHL